MTDVPSTRLNGHVAEGYVVAHMWLPICPYGIGEAKGCGGSRKGVTGVGGSNDVVSDAASGDGGTGMLEGMQI